MSSTDLVLAPVSVRGPCPVCSRPAGALPRVRCPACAVELDRECFGLVERCPTYACAGLDGAHRLPRRAFRSADLPARRPRAYAPPLPARAIGMPLEPVPTLRDSFLDFVGTLAGGLSTAADWAGWLVMAPFVLLAEALASDPFGTFWGVVEVVLNLLWLGTMFV